MDKLDRAVADHLEWRILDPQRLAVMMDQLLERREEWTARRRGHIAELRKRQAEAEAKLKRLYEAIENGLVNLADPSLKDRIAEPTAIRDQSQADAERASAAVERLGPEVTPESLRRFALSARRKLKERRRNVSARPPPGACAACGGGQQKRHSLDGLENRTSANTYRRCKRRIGVR